MTTSADQISDAISALGSVAAVASESVEKARVAQNLAQASFDSRSAFEGALIGEQVQMWTVVHPAPQDANARILTYRRDANGTAIVSMNGVKGSPAGERHVEHYGAVGDGLTDDTDAIKAAIADLGYGQKLHFYGRDYLVSEEIRVAREGVKLIGQSAGSYWDNKAGYGTRIIGAHTQGAVFRLMLESIEVADMLIDATPIRSVAPRNTSALHYNCGIRVEAEDVPAPEGDVFNTRLRNVHVTGQPADGLALIGRIYESVLDGVHCNSNNGHGIAISNGTYTGRANKAPPGVLTIRNCSWKYNQGHSVRAGGFGEDFTLRLLIHNCEGLYNCGNPAFLEAPADGFYNCDSLTILNGAATGEAKAGAVPARNAGYALMGLGGTLVDSRILQSSVPVKLLKSPLRRTEGWTIHGPHIRDTDADHIAQIDPGVKNIVIWAGDETGGLTKASDVATDQIAGLEVTIAGVRQSNIPTTHFQPVQSSDGINVLAVKQTISVTTVPVPVLDAITAGRKWTIHGAHTGDPCLSSFSCDVVGGATPVVSNLQQQDGAAVDFVVTVDGTDIELATSSGTRHTQIAITEVIS